MKKRRLKEVLYGYEIRITGIIANGLVNKTPKAIIFRNIKKEIARTGRYLDLDEAEIQLMWMKATNLHGKISKETFKEMRVSDRKFGKDTDYEEYLAFRKEAVYNSVRNHMSDLEKDKNLVANTVEYRVKFAEKQEILQSDNIFYVCNWFDDCAKDHIPYQGKMYVLADWEEKVDEDMHGKIAAYIKNHKILTVQEVVNEAPWLTTRRNCRHNLYPIPVEEVLGSSVNSILKKRKLKAKHENEYNMVLTPEKVAYIGYYERLKALRYLNKLFSCEKLESDIKETRKMMLKWYRAVAEKNNQDD